MPFSEEPVLFPLCTVWSPFERVCPLCFTPSASKKEAHTVDMPLRTKKSRRHKSILRKSKRRNRTRRVRFAGGVVGTRWFITSKGSIPQSDYEQHQEYQDQNPEAY
jgi:hypothetical protein